MPTKHATKSKKHYSHTKLQSETLSTVQPAGDQSLHPQTEQSNPQLRIVRAKNKKDNNGDRPDKRRIARLSLVFTLALVLTTIVYTYFSYNQWQSMQDALHEAVRTREIENRAYLTVKQIELRKELASGERPAAVITFIDTGNTPAQNVRVMSFIASRGPSEAEPDVRTITDLSSAQSKGVLSREMSINAIVESPTILTDELIQRVNKGELRLYVWGVLGYDDMFGQSHKTGFCGALIPGSKGFDMCSQGNIAD